MTIPIDVDDAESASAVALGGSVVGVLAVGGRGFALLQTEDVGAVGAQERHDGVLTAGTPYPLPDPAHQLLH